MTENTTLNWLRLLFETSIIIFYAKNEANDVAKEGIFVRNMFFKLCCINLNLTYKYRYEEENILWKYYVRFTPSQKGG